jgi:hypothetical protein
MNKRRRWKAKARRAFSRRWLGPFKIASHPIMAVDGVWFRPAPGVFDNAAHWLKGLKPLPPFTLNIHWGPPTLPCGVCSAPVAMPADGQPLPQLEHNGTSSPLCDPCAMALMSTAD